MSTRETVGDVGPIHCLTPTLIDPELRAAFLMTVERRRSQLQRVAMNMLRCQEDAEDIVQESVLKALRFLPRFRGEARIDTWLHAIVVNTARDWLRLRRQRAQAPMEAESEEWDDVLALEIPSPSEDPEESCSRHELERLLQEEIHRLDPIYQMPIRLCDLGGRSYREAAVMLKLTGPAMKARLFRARGLLKKRLRRHARSPEPTRAETRDGRSRRTKTSRARASLV